MFDLLDAFKGNMETIINDIIEWEDEDFRDNLANIYLGDFIEDAEEADIWEDLISFNNYEIWAERFLMAMDLDSRERLADSIKSLYY